MATPLELLQGGVAQNAVPKTQPTPQIPVAKKDTATVAQTPTSVQNNAKYVKSNDGKYYVQSKEGSLLEPDVVAMAKSIRQHETGNKQKTGATGETKSKYQFLPSTWKTAAQKYLGDANAPITGINEDKVAYAQIKEWKDKGYKPSQIAAAWNAGEGSLQGDKWKSMVGVNQEYGVKYDVPAYVNSVLANYQKEKENYLKQTQGQEIQQTEQTQQLPGVSEAAQQVLGTSPIGKTLGALSDFGLGAVQQTGKTLGGASALGERMLRGTLKTLLPKSVEEKLGIEQPSNQVPTAIEQSKLYQQVTTPQSKAQKAGQVTTEIGSYLIPGTSALKVGKAAEAAMIGGKLLKAGARLGATGLTETALGTGISGINTGKIGDEQIGAGVVQGVASLVLPPVFEAVGKGIKAITMPLAKAVKNDISQMASKALKPFYGGKPIDLVKYTKATESAVDTISKVVPKNELPKDTVTFYNGLKKAKEAVWNIVSNIRKQAGEAGLTFEPANVTLRLNAIAEDVAKTPQIRQAARKMIGEIEELRGLSPEVVQQRLQTYNQELSTFFNKVTPKTDRQYVVAEISQLIRDNLDDQISSYIANSGNKELLSRYSALKTIEKDLYRQVNLVLRRGNKGSPGLSDMFGVYFDAEFVAGLILDSKEAVVKGLTGKSINELLKYLSSGDRYIEKAFSGYDKLLGNTAKKLQSKTPIKFTNTESKLPIQNLNLPKLGTGKVNVQGTPIPLKAPGKSYLGITEINIKK